MTPSAPDLAAFEHDLARIVGRPTDLRPFVCTGSPLRCAVFIVGYNPATPMAGDWWRFWASDVGFDRQAWAAAYAAQRQGAGKTGRSKTRTRIEGLIAALGDVAVLEANIDARPSARKSAYPRPVTEPFDYLLQTIRPRVVIAHGVDAVAHLQGWRDEGVLIECPHFIYVGQDRMGQMVQRARAALGGSGG